MQKSVVILGATGLVGSALVEELIQDPQVSEIRILTRRPLAFSSEKIKLIQTDLSKPAPDAFTNATALYCCIGTTRKKHQTKHNTAQLTTAWPSPRLQQPKMRAQQKFISSVPLVPIRSPRFFTAAWKAKSNATFKSSTLNAHSFTSRLF